MSSCTKNFRAASMFRKFAITLVSHAATSLFVFSAGACAQTVTAANDPRELAVNAVANELKVIQYQNSYLQYQVHTRDAKGDQIRKVVETKDGTVARVLLRESRALTSEEDAAERARLQAMLDSPSAFQKHIEKDKTGKKLAADMIKLVPEAMLFEFVPGQPQREHKPKETAPEYVIDFSPNPKWNPPTMSSQALTGIKGRCWIDAKTHNLAKLDATIFQGVNFGFGFFAHVYPGGQLSLEQQAVTEDRWIVNRFVEHLSVRALMVKTVSENTDLYAFDFIPIHEMSYRDGIHLLLASSPPAAGADVPR